MGELAKKQNQPQRDNSSKSARSEKIAPQPDIDTNAILQMQRAIGNQAVLRMLRSQESEQEAAHDAPQEDDMREAASEGIAGLSAPLPHLDTIQQSFGNHDVSGVAAHTDERATAAGLKLGAVGYATDNHVAFVGAPDLHTAAHEAAHVVQQRGGVQLAGEIGQAGDRYEQHADAVADAVVRGDSSEALLDEYADSAESHKGTGRGGAHAPEHGKAQMKIQLQKDDKESKESKEIRKRLLDEEVIKALDAADVAFLLEQDFGKNILSDLSLPQPSTSKRLNVLMAGSLAFTLGMLKQRNDFIREQAKREHPEKKGKAPTSKAIKSAAETLHEDLGWSSLGTMEEKAAFSKGDKVRRATKRELIDRVIMHPDMPSESKRNAINKIAERGTPDEDLKPDLYSPEVQAKVVSSITKNAEPFFKKLIELGWVIDADKDTQMPDQFLAATGNKRESTGIGGALKAGIGYFMYGKEGATKTLTINFPPKGPLVVRMSAYGLEQQAPTPTHVSVTGGATQLVEVGFNKIKTTVTVSSDAEANGVKAPKKERAITITIPEEYKKIVGGTITFKTWKEPPERDEVQVQFSTGGTIVENKLDDPTVKKDKPTVSEEPVKEEEDDKITEETKDEDKPVVYTVGKTFILKNIYFDIDKYFLKPESKAELEKLLKILNDYPTMQIEIAGHTDNAHTPEHNQKLSENRAKAVVDWLVKHKIEPSRLTSHGYGEDSPIESNDTEEGRAKNRRVEFIIIKM